MSADYPIRPIAMATAPDGERHVAEYLARVEILRRSYRRRAHSNGFAANCVSLLLVSSGAAVGLSPLVATSPSYIAVLGVSVILLEGVSRVLHPAQRAAAARKVARRLDRAFRLYDARGRGSEMAFVSAIERILEQADAEEEGDQILGGDRLPLPR